MVQIKNNLKKSTIQSPPSSHSVGRGGDSKVRSSSSLNITVPKIIISNDINSDQQLQKQQHQQSIILSAPTQQTYLRHAAATQRKSIRLKPNNILIEQENEQESADENNTTVAVSASASLSAATNVAATSSSFDSRALQSEIEHLKRMRQNYGTDWLLSTPNMLDQSQQNLLLKAKAKNEQQGEQQWRQQGLRSFGPLEAATETERDGYY